MFILNNVFNYEYIYLNKLIIDNFKNKIIYSVIHNIIIMMFYIYTMIKFCFSFNKLLSVIWTATLHNYNKLSRFSISWLNGAIILNNDNSVTINGFDENVSVSFISEKNKRTKILVENEGVIIGEAPLYTKKKDSVQSVSDSSSLRNNFKDSDEIYPILEQNLKSKSNLNKTINSLNSSNNNIFNLDNKNELWENFFDMVWNWDLYYKITPLISITIIAGISLFILINLNKQLLSNNKININFLCFININNVSIENNNYDFTNVNLNFNFLFYFFIFLSLYSMYKKCKALSSLVKAKYENKNICPFFLRYYNINILKIIFNIFYILVSIFLFCLIYDLYIFIEKWNNCSFFMINDNVYKLSKLFICIFITFLNIYISFLYNKGIIFKNILINLISIIYITLWSLTIFNIDIKLVYQFILTETTSFLILCILLLMDNFNYFFMNNSINNELLSVIKSNINNEIKNRPLVLYAIDNTSEKTSLSSDKIINNDSNNRDINKDEKDTNESNISNNNSKPETTDSNTVSNDNEDISISNNDNNSDITTGTDLNQSNEEHEDPNESSEENPDYDPEEDEVETIAYEISELRKDIRVLNSDIDEISKDLSKDDDDSSIDDENDNISFNTGKANRDHKIDSTNNNKDERSSLEIKREEEDRAILERKIKERDNYVSIEKNLEKRLQDIIGKYRYRRR